MSNKFEFNPFTGTFDLKENIEASDTSVILNLVCLTDVFIGAVVSFNISGVAINAIATNSNDSNIIGVVEAKPTTTTCNVRVDGISSALYSSLDPQKTYYLSDTSAGNITTTVPTTSGSYIVPVGRPIGTTKLAVQIQARMIRA